MESKSTVEKEGLERSKEGVWKRLGEVRNVGEGEGSDEDGDKDDGDDKSGDADE